MKQHYIYEDKEYWFCENCGQVVQDEDAICWNCKDDISEEKR